MKAYQSLFSQYRDQPVDSIFAHFYAIDGDWDESFKLIARQTSDGVGAWAFSQQRFIDKHPRTSVPKLKNYLSYTFKRLVDLEIDEPGKYFVVSQGGDWTAFNTGLQNSHGSDLLAIFQRYVQRDDGAQRADWVFKGCYPPNDRHYRDHFGSQSPEIAWFSKDSSDFVFNTLYHLDRDVFDHLFDRAKERAGLPHASDEQVHNYLRGALENLIPKIKRNYKVAIPVWYVEEKRMQLLLPFMSATIANDVSCFLIDRNDATASYQIKTIFDLDQAYFAARLITRPDRDWLNP